MINYLELAENEKDYIIALRRDFHKHPETAFKEYRTAERIEAELDKFAISHERIGETGVIGVLRGGIESEKSVALRADIDALCIKEINKVEYVSENEGIMHACGHDAHTAMLLGAAKILAQNRETIEGEVRFIFQPAEEVGAGAKRLLEEKDGTLGRVDKIFGIHCAPDLRSGTVGIKKGINNASVDHFIIKINGKSSHVCAPEKGVDALYIASQVVVALQGIVTRLTSPVEPVVIGVGKLSAGTSYNIVAGEAVLEGTTRNISHENRKKVNEFVEKTAISIAELYGGSAEIEWEDFASPLINPSEGCDEVKKMVDDVLGEGHVIADREVYMSGDDFCEYQKEIPGVYAYLGTGNPKKNNTQNAYHSNNFDIDEDALSIGAALYAAFTAL